MIRTALALALFPAVIAGSAAAQPAVSEKSVDAVFSRWNTTTPGCAVGVAAAGKPVLMKAYGMADLEHDVPNTPETIFESGSLAKQFTAMAILLLAKDGKLSLDDQVRKHIPELPDYGVPLTIRHMLTHTSGLRDWGSVAGIAGAPRTSREYTHGHVLDIVSRQKSLNFTPGTQYSYSNTGYNLSAIIVSRLSGMSFADFSKRRIFEPLGMTSTQWRDDHQRIVKRRAIAYRPSGDGYQIEMPFENVHGNGGLLTTVGDLLKWNENFVNPKVGDPALVMQQQTRGRFNDGREHDYALGLRVNALRGVKNVNHSGSTAGYVTHLNRFPEAHLSVAVLCNVSSGAATNAANDVSVLYLGDRVKEPATRAERKPDPPTVPVAANTLQELAGRYWSDEAEVVLVAAIEKDQLVLKRRPDTTITLRPIGTDTFEGSIGRVTFLRNGSGRVNELSIRQDRVWDLRFARQ
ncbi:MAG TPA: serine hydrolase domain-containing protein [Vicinamibacterales bacterium]|nr:serine hydrolase domain-containing protein [Vicinamibacterales bacterium]